MSPEFYWVAVALVTIVSASRITRLLTFDVFPPARKLREIWGDVMDAHAATRGWVILFFCPWCMSFWATLAVVVWADLSGVYDGGAITDSDLWAQFWWIANGTLAASYLAAMLMVRDGDNSTHTEDESDEVSV